MGSCASLFPFPFSPSSPFIQMFATSKAIFKESKAIVQDSKKALGCEEEGGEEETKYPLYVIPPKHITRLLDDADVRKGTRGLRILVMDGGGLRV